MKKAPCRSEYRGGAAAPTDRDKIGHRAWRRRLDGPCAASPRSRRSSFSRSGRISRVDVQLHTDRSARGANLAAHRLKLRSRLRDVYVLRPHPWALDVTRNAGACDAPRKRLLETAADTQYAKHSLTSPEGSGRGENPGNSTNNGPVARARAR